MNNSNVRQKKKTTMYFDEKIYVEFQKWCKFHKLPMNITIEVMMERFNDNQKRIQDTVIKYGKIKIAKQKLDEAQGRNVG